MNETDQHEIFQCPRCKWYGNADGDDRRERLLGTIPKLARASAPVFDYAEATRIARGGTFDFSPSPDATTVAEHAHARGGLEGHVRSH